MQENWHGKTVLITGVCGTVGRELLHQTMALGQSEIIGIDNNESELFFVASPNRIIASTGPACSSAGLPIAITIPWLAGWESGLTLST